MMYRDGIEGSYVNFNWTKSYCKSESAIIVEPRSFLDHDYIMDNLMPPKNGDEDQRLWLGITDEEDEGV